MDLFEFFKQLLYRNFFKNASSLKNVLIENEKVEVRS